MLGPDGRHLPRYHDPRKFSLSRTFAYARALAFENLGSLVVIGALVSAAPRLGIWLLALPALPALRQSPLPIEWWLPVLFVVSLTIGHLLPSYLLVGAIAGQADDAMAGKPVRILPALRSAIVHLPAMTLSAFAIGLTLALSLPMLLVPAIAIVPLMMPAPASCVVRKQGLRAALAESAAIAKGNRRTIILAGGGWLLAISMLGQATEYFFTSAVAVGFAPSLPLLIAPTLVLLSLEAIIGACISIAIYTEARQVADHQASAILSQTPEAVDP